MHYVYTLKSYYDEELHIGQTNDLKRRLKEQSGGKSFALLSELHPHLGIMKHIQTNVT